MPVTMPMTDEEVAADSSETSASSSSSSSSSSTDGNAVANILVALSKAIIRAPEAVLWDLRTTMTAAASQQHGNSGALSPNNNSCSTRERRVASESSAAVPSSSSSSSSSVIVGADMMNLSLFEKNFPLLHRVVMLASTSMMVMMPDETEETAMLRPSQAPDPDRSPKRRQRSLTTGDMMRGEHSAGRHDGPAAASSALASRPIDGDGGEAEATAAAAMFGLPNQLSAYVR